MFNEHSDHSLLMFSLICRPLVDGNNTHEENNEENNENKIPWKPENIANVRSIISENIHVLNQLIETLADDRPRGSTIHDRPRGSTIHTYSIRLGASVMRNQPNIYHAKIYQSKRLNIQWFYASCQEAKRGQRYNNACL